MAEAIFVQTGEQRFLATELARGPWDRDAQHGGAPAALLMRAFERLPAGEGMVLGRVTYELLRPAPLAELRVSADAVRSGRRVQLLEGSLATVDGVEVVRARALRVRLAQDAPPTPPASPPPAPGTGRPNRMVPPHRPMFAPDAVEIRFVEGGFGGGPSTAWFRLRVPVVEGEEPSALQRLAAAGDFGNGISAPLSWENWTYINPDLTLYLERAPQGEWIALEARTHIAAGGIAMSDSVLYDPQGRVGRASQALLVAPRARPT